MKFTAKLVILSKTAFCVDMESSMPSYDLRRELVERYTTGVVDTKEAAVREALIKLGGTPPPERTEDKKCIVHGCPNRKSEGNFVGDLCAPCHQFITTGEIGCTSSFLGDIHTAATLLQKHIIKRS